MFGSCKSISGKYSIFWKCYFPERKMFSCVLLHFKKFSEKYFLCLEKKKEKTNLEKKKIINDRRSTGFDGVVLRELQFDDRRSTSGAIAISQISRSHRFLLHLGLSGFVFSFFFSKHQKIFFRNFFEMQPNT